MTTYLSPEVYAELEAATTQEKRVAFFNKHRDPTGEARRVWKQAKNMMKYADADLLGACSPQLLADVAAAQILLSLSKFMEA